MSKKFTLELGQDYARGAIQYKGVPTNGMLAWIDADAIKKWWCANTSKFEPLPGGLFYLAWDHPTKKDKEVIYGVVENIDAEKNTIDVGRIIYISANNKLENIHLHVAFQQVDEFFAEMVVTHNHKFSGQVKAAYEEVVQQNWPMLFEKIKDYLEANN
jgi:uncharacterized protein YndB with AHSA1/START domain